MTSRSALVSLRWAVAALSVAGAQGAWAQARAGAEVPSGLAAGERALPFTANMVTGPHRGVQHCYVCGLKDEPALVVFARRMDEPTGRLLAAVQSLVRTRRAERLFAWAVFLSREAKPDMPAFESDVLAFARKRHLTPLPIAALGDPAGPPGYRIDPGSAVTLLALRDGKVVGNRTVRSDAWSAARADALARELPTLCGLSVP